MQKRLRIRSLFEKSLLIAPKKLIVWQTYIYFELRNKCISNARHLLHRLLQLYSFKKIVLDKAFDLEFNFARSFLLEKEIRKISFDNIVKYKHSNIRKNTLQCQTPKQCKRYLPDKSFKSFKSFNTFLCYVTMMIRCGIIDKVFIMIESFLHANKKSHILNGLSIFLYLLKFLRESGQSFFFIKQIFAYVSQKKKRYLARLKQLLNLHLPNNIQDRFIIESKNFKEINKFSSMFSSKYFTKYTEWNCFFDREFLNAKAHDSYHFDFTLLINLKKTITLFFRGKKTKKNENSKKQTQSKFFVQNLFFLSQVEQLLFLLINMAAIKTPNHMLLDFLSLNLDILVCRLPNTKSLFIDETKYTKIRANSFVSCKFSTFKNIISH